METIEVFNKGAFDIVDIEDIHQKTIDFSTRYFYFDEYDDEVDCTDEFTEYQEFLD